MFFRLLYPGQSYPIRSGDRGDDFLSQGRILLRVLIQLTILDNSIGPPIYWNVTTD